MKKGTLHVRILEGRNVKETDLIGQADPFVEFWIDGQEKQKTETRKNTDTPVWLHETTIPLNGNENNLYIRLLDKDLLRSDDLGETRVDLAQLYQHYFLDSWVSVRSPKSKESTGEVHLVLEYFPKVDHHERLANRAF
ncbi:8701_t:CDS:2 [Ambispora leptoticha]|uniref:8701_t:CDS:1 n=1 Tax=Ambispora leptoticha TaxID=144679 RepID=A0A9N8WHE9_9GLOM|nr:8701_t:CDS:2 [Ambispora leptoticha]